jgi:hypothetical protein
MSIQGALEIVGKACSLDHSGMSKEALPLYEQAMVIFEKIISGNFSNITFLNTIISKKIQTQM